MKTDLIEMTKVVSVNKSTDRPRFQETQSVRRVETDMRNETSSNTFNETLKNQTNSKKEYEPSPVRKVSHTSEAKSEVKEEDLEVKSENPDEIKNQDIEEIVEEVFVDLPNEQVQEIAEEISKANSFDEIEKIDEEKNPELLDDFLALFSNETNLKIPNLEKYVSTMRNEGKSVQQILNSLKNVLDEFNLNHKMLLEEVAEISEKLSNPVKLISEAVEEISKTISFDEIEKSGGEKNNELLHKILTLLSNKTNLKIPNLEKYFSTMRNEGKSVQQILNSLKNFLNDVNTSKKTDLKDFVLKVVHPDNDGKEKSIAKGSIADKLIPKTHGQTTGETTKKTTDPNSPTVPVLQSDTKLSKQQQESVVLKTQKKVISVEEKADPVNDNVIGKEKNNSDAHITENALEENKGDNKQLPVDEKILNLFNQKTSVSGALGTEKQKEPQENSKNLLTQDPNKVEPNTESKKTNEVSREIPVLTAKPQEKMTQFISESLNVSKEGIKQFFNSGLIPREHITLFVESFKNDDPSQFLRNNDALLSQIKEFLKIHNKIESDTKLPVPTKTFTVDTRILKQLISRTFSSKEFSNNLTNVKENILLKTKQSVFTVEKLSVKFVTKPTYSKINNGKGSLKTRSTNTLQKETHSIKRFIQPSFKNGYETTSQRISDLSRFNSQTATKEPNTQGLDNSAGKTTKNIGQTFAFDKQSEVKTHTTSVTEGKGLHKPKATVENEQNSHQNDFKAVKRTPDTVVRNQTTTHVKNIEQVYKQIKDMTQLMARQNTRTELATIRLNPPELGKVSLEIVKEGNKISILMQVETKDAQEILTKNSSMLATRLSNSGFDVQKVQINLEKQEESGEDQTNGQGQNNSEQQGEKGNQDRQNENDYFFDEDYSFADLLKGGIKENAG